jgi:membrane protease YdiL (CAAX protease family)
VLLVCVAFLAGGILQQLGAGSLDALGVTTETAPAFAQAVPMALQFVGFFAVCGTYLAWREDDTFFEIGRPTWRDVRWTMLGFSALVATLVGFEFVLTYFGLAPADNVVVQLGRETPRLFLYLIPIVLFLNAPAEELLFRGVVQGLFRRAYGVVPGVLAASLIFGGIHYLALADSGSRVAYVGIAMLSGLVLGALYEYTENLLVPIAAHACWNVLVYVNLYLTVTGAV